MRPADDKDHLSLDDPAWVLLAEFSLPGQPGCDEQEAEQALGLLVEVVRDLGLPLAHLNRIKGIVSEAMRNAIKHRDQCGTTLPIFIRLYTQAKSIKSARHVSGKAKQVTSGGQESLITGQTETRQGSVSTEKQLNGGWGYFLLGRVVDHPNVLAGAVHYSLELFLYAEGK